jgi:parallel beta-helix repeat protein
MLTYRLLKESSVSGSHSLVRLLRKKFLRALTNNTNKQKRRSLKRVFSVALFILLLTSMLTLASNIKVGRSSSTTITVPDDYSSIQEAINHAGEGDTIFVRNGTYYENVVVNKTISLIGEKKSTTIVDGGGDGGKSTVVIGVTASDVHISGFTVRNGMDGIQTQHEASVTTIDGNMLSNSVYGVHIYSNSNIVSENEFFSNEYGGVGIEQSGDNAIRQNVFEENSWGAVLFLSSDNIISQNIITNSSWLGISLQGSCNNVIEGNSLSNGGGIGLGFSWDRIYYHPSGNTIFHNNFINTTEAYVDPNAVDNVWDNGCPSGGNYWSDYNATDLYSGPCQNITGSDGIGDLPHVIDENNQDRYPLMKPYVALFGDLNQDRTVDILDAILIAAAFGSYPGHLHWNSLADLNQDNKINILDMILLASNFGKGY